MVTMKPKTPAAEADARRRRRLRIPYSYTLLATIYQSLVSIHPWRRQQCRRRCCSWPRRRSLRWSLLLSPPAPAKVRRATRRTAAGASAWSSRARSASTPSAATATPAGPTCSRSSRPRRAPSQNAPSTTRASTSPSTSPGASRSLTLAWPSTVVREASA
ncbi:hypothetical protein EE612_051495 [Oryza sativa]|nr:hypothetical protein EE612_051495 [Oryza sativa]